MHHCQVEAGDLGDRADDRLTAGRHWARSGSGAEQLDAPGATESGPDGGKGPFGRVRGGNQPVRGDLPKIEILSVDHRADQPTGGAEPEQRRRRRFDRDTHAERRAQRGRGNSAASTTAAPERGPAAV